MTGEDEERFTLAEAKKILAEEECRWRGHSTSQIVNGLGEILGLVCDTCGAEWRVERIERGRGL